MQIQLKYNMKDFKSILFAFTLVGFLLPGCSDTKSAKVVPPAPVVPLVGGDADEHGCKASAGYQWCTLQKECIRSFELPLQLLNADKTSGAGVAFSADKKQAEVFSAMGTVVLTAKTATLFTGNSGGTNWYLEQTGGKWMFGKKGEAKPSYTEK
jgi:hypothetical protein